MSQLSIHKASAGSGKTFQLALCYIRLALGYKDEETDQWKLFYPYSTSRHRETLAITFTNKATDEMKQRIINELAALSDLKVKSSYRERLTEDFKTDAVTIAKASHQALIDILFDFGHFNVKTIDSFFQTVLRSFAYEADIAGNYGVSIDDDLLMESSIESTLSTLVRRRGTKAHPTLRLLIKDAIKEFSEKGSNFYYLDKDSQIRKDLKAFMSKLSTERYLLHRDVIDGYFAEPDRVPQLLDALRKKKSELEKELYRLGCEMQSDPSWEGVNRSKKPRKFIEAMTEPPFEYEAKVFCGLPPELTATSKKTISDSLASLYDEFQKIAVDWVTLEHIMKGMHHFGLFSFIKTQSKRLLASNNTIMISDTNAILRDIIAGSDTPFVYERTGSRLKHYLIDEFQDTSRMQWGNLRPLVKESLDSGNDNLIIGDVKQSIYRFRNSDYRLLDHELEEDAAINHYISENNADTNYRSAEDVVDFNNRLFKYIGDVCNPSVYEHVYQKANKSGLKGYVSISTLPAEPSTGVPAGLAPMLEEIKRELDPLRGGYSPGDIVVLARTNFQAKKIVDFLLKSCREDEELQRRNVSVLSDEALFLKSAKSVQYMVGILRAMIEDETAEEAVDSDEAEPAAYMGHSTEEDFLWFKNKINECTFDIDSSSESFQKVMNEFHSFSNHAEKKSADLVELVGKLQGRSVFEIVEAMIKHLDPEWLREEAIYIGAFQDLVTEFVRYGTPTVYGFLQYWDEQKEKASVGLSAEVDAIRVMTIHKSKGLEFPCVHIPIMDGELVSETDIRWYDASKAFESLGLESETPKFFPIKSVSQLTSSLFKEEYEGYLNESLLDSVNTLYVAFTRAERELIVSMDYVAGGNTQKVQTMMARLLADDETFVDNGAAGWSYTLGSPTRKQEDKRAVESRKIESLPLPCYEASKRRDIWESIILDDYDEE